MGTFINEFDQVIPNSLEWVEQALANAYVERADCILELGARYGMVSVAANRQLAEPTWHLAVEPDHRVISALKRNVRYFCVDRV